MTDARATDAESRKQIVTDFDHTLFVEAGAGSGKTTAMVSRIMTVLLNGLADIREIAAITFTNEGAASLKSKIQHDLEKAAREGKYATFSGATLTMTAAENERIRKALSYLPLANFSTIHSFCLELLKERPVEAGIDPRFEMNTAGTAEPVFVEAWFRFLIDAARRKHQFLQFAVEEGLDLDGIQKMAEERCENPDLDLYTEKVKPISGKKIEDAFAKAFGLAKEMSDNVGELKRAKPTAVGARRIEFVEEYFKRAESCKSTEEKKRFLLEEEIFHKWVEKVRFFLECANGLQVIQDGLKKMNLDYIHLQIAAFIEEFGEFFGKYKRSSSALDFTDFLFLTREVLRNIREVREYFKGRFKYIFVDEMQDVDPLQTEILFFLAEAPGSFAAEWKDVKLVPSKLFMVGDPKQSIFRFRRADITMFVEVRELVRAQGGEILSLDKNFRSAVEIIEFVNDHFQESFEGYRAGITERLHPEYEKLSAAAPVQSKMPKHVFMLESLAGVANATTPDLLADELRKLNSFIREITSPSGPKIYDPEIQAERSILFSDIMLLLKNFTEVGEYTRFFEAEDIPHYEVGGRTFFDTEDVRALAFALKAIDDPTDTIALFGALKSPVFGIDDQMMFDYMSSGHKFNIWVSGGTSEDSLSMALNLFKELHYTRELLRPSGVLKELFNATGVCHLALRDPNGLQKSSKYFRLLELLNEIEVDRSLSFRAGVEVLFRVMENDDPKLAHITISNTGSNAVKITTIHRAKGLEAPVVIVGGSHIKEYKGDGPSSFDLRGEGKILIPYSKVGGYYTTDPDILKQREQRKEDCESERLRYVAATRARDILVVCVAGGGSKGDPFTGKFISSLRRSKLVGQVAVSNAKPANERLSGKMDPAKLASKGQEAKAERLKNVANSLASFYTPFQTVHEVIEVDTALFRAGGRKSRGTGYGTVLHRLMQHFLSSDSFDPATVVDDWMQEEGVVPRLRGDLLAACKALLESKCVRDARASTERYCEWEFFLKKDDKIITGVIDLAYRNASGEWIIVDYKTDDVSDAARKAKLDAVYSKQLQQYAEAFEAITKLKVAKTEMLYSEELVGRPA